MAKMSGNNEISSRDFGDSSKLTNQILDSAATRHMTPKVSEVIPALSGDTDNILQLQMDITSQQIKKENPNKSV